MSIHFQISRRDWLTAGATAFGLPQMCGRIGRASAETAPRGARSIILVYLPGGLAQHESFDLKPQAPAEVRGEFQPIDTAVPGISISEYLPRLAQRMSRYALVRSMSHTENNHFPATHLALTGRVMPRQLPGDATNAATRNDWPCYSSAYDAVRPRDDGIPNGVALPHPLAGGAIPWPGQYGGFLGPRHDPWQLNRDPNQPTFRDDSLTLPVGVTIDRVGRRQKLLEQFEQQRLAQLQTAAAGAYTDRHVAAMNLLTSGQMAKAFELEREPDALRDEYGRHSFGQSLLLARRLVQAGVPIVQANMGPVQTWDTHEKNFVSLRDSLLPALDRGLSALLDDLSATGLLAETMIIVTGEFGRTPASSVLPGSQFAGRNHWAPVYSALFAGGGVQGGQVIGSSDAIGAYPVSRSFSPADLAATIFSALGISTQTEIQDQFGRRFAVSNGQPISELYQS